MELLAVFLPGLAFVLTAFYGRTLGDRNAQLLTCSGVVLAALASLIVAIDVTVFDGARVTRVATWMHVGSFTIDWALRIDALSAVMLVVINLVSALVHIYSVGYMSHDPDQPRFMAYLSLFTFAMLMLVTAENLVQMFFGWEGVGLASYLLIGFWWKKDSANQAAMKAFIVNRVGDFGFALGIMTLFFLFDSVSFTEIFARIDEVQDRTIDLFGWQVHGLTLAGLLLFMGAAGKSAQLGLHTWLPDAMEGPTPVSALIHAATMVTAGVFMLCRMSPLLEYAPAALEVVAVFGALTAFVAATIGMTQYDIKRVIAYSTMSQLGYMFFAVGVHAYGAAMFHLTTHAFFKALLFLGAGSVIHALSGEQDMRRMGGLRRLIPQTYLVMVIGSLALAGIPFFAGFYSKDAILNAAWAAGSIQDPGFETTGFGTVAWTLGIAAALMTAFYSFRLIFMVFFGSPRADAGTMEHVHESPYVMMAPLSLLAGLAVIAGFALEPHMAGHNAHAFWDQSIQVRPERDVLAALVAGHEHGAEHGAAEADHAGGEAEEHGAPAQAEAGHGEQAAGAAKATPGYHVPFLVHWAGVIAGLTGIALAWLIYVRAPGSSRGIREGLGPIHAFVYRKWLFDELYDLIFVRPAPLLGRFLWQKGDRGTIDRLGPDGVSLATLLAAARARTLQTGFVYHYAFASVVGLVGLLSWFLFQADL